MINVRNRIQNETLAIVQLLRMATKAGWGFISVNNGEEYIHTPHISDVIEHVFSVDESVIEMGKLSSGNKVGIFIVLGNSGLEVVSDISSHKAEELEEFEKDVWEQFSAWLDEVQEDFLEFESTEY